MFNVWTGFGCFVNLIRHRRQSP